MVTAPRKLARFLSVGAAVGAIASLALTGCGAGSGAASSSSQSSQSGSTAAAQSEVSVFAAASLTDVLPKLEEAYGKTGPEQAATKFVSNLAGSQTLVQQINGGTLPDVLVTADEASIQAIKDPAQFSNKGIIAKNALVLVVPSDSTLASVDDFTVKLSEASAPRVAICASDVPCGRATQKFVDAQKLTFQNVSEEADVRSVLSKVTAGEVDAGFVYATDAKSAGDKVKTIKLPDAPTNSYPLLVNANASTSGMDYGDWLAGSEAKKVLQDEGFTTP